jgi:hypothetical protein
MRIFLALLFALTGAHHSPAQTPRQPYSEWQHSGVLTILTGPEGANLAAGAIIEEFPLLIRLHKEWFPFGEAAPAGEDVRFSAANGSPLHFQIDTWDRQNGSAEIWVRIPRIEGNARQGLVIHWGMPGAQSASNGAAVFNDSNGYLSVWHLGTEAKDEVGTLESKDVGTTLTSGIIGMARHFAGKQGIFCGEKITNYPSADSPHSTEAWFRAERPNATLIGWGNEGGGRGSKVRMQLRSPPHVRIDSDFSDVKSESRLSLGEWVHVVHTYHRGNGRIYINGRLDGEATPLLNIKSPARLWLGGWYHNYDFIGDLDEVRISKVTRSPEWVQLQFENQKPLQTVVGHIPRGGSSFSVTPARAIIPEGMPASFTAEAGGAQKITWILREGERETVLAVDRFICELPPRRVQGDSKATLLFRAVFPAATKTLEIPVTISEAIEEPDFKLQAPATWDGRSAIQIVPQIANLSALQSKRASDVKIAWAVGPFATVHDALPDKLILRRAQQSGALVVSATASNGGPPVTKSVTIEVKEPAQDPWIAREPSDDEQPVDDQFYARDNQGEGTLVARGTLKEPVDEVFLKIFADEKPYFNVSAKPQADRSYAFSARLKPGLVKYRMELGTRMAGVEAIVHSARNLVCGDAYLINGQSNAVATDWGKEEYTFTSEWIRAFGSPESGAQGARAKIWGNAEARPKGGKLQVGCWAMELGRRLVENYKVPVCFLNGAVGGTRIDQHQRNAADPLDVNTIYGRLLWRARAAGLTHGIRAVLWHQGENDQGADGPTGGFGWETYRAYFIDLAAGWRQDFPNLQHIYVFQIWPKSCAMGINGSDNRLREVQRRLPEAFSRMSIMSTLGIEPPGGCHFPPAGYAEIARLICPLIERDFYGRKFDASITPPNLRRASFASASKDEVLLEFDQPVQWDNNLAGQFYLDGAKGKVSSGITEGSSLRLKLLTPSEAKQITYLDSAAWSQKTLLRGLNGIAALTFCEVPIEH